MTDTRRSFADLSQQDDFLRRHIGPTHAEQAQMLGALGLSTRDELVAQVIPGSIRMEGELALGEPRTESQVLQELRRIASRNRVLRSCIGTGYHDTHIPPVILRNLLENPGWYTSYTPYQPEISQGRLEVLLNFQTLVADLTGMQIANASLLDEASAAAEAMTFCRRLARNKGRRFYVSDECHPQTIDVVRTRAEPLGIEVVVGDAGTFDCADGFGVLLQYPASTGAVHDLGQVAERVHQNQGLVAVAADLLALTLIKPPGEWGADVAVGTAQRFGVPMGYGGPHAAYFATRDAFKREMPGRLVGVSIDSAGHPAYRLAMQTREQHIRREKASSNICTAQALLAMIAACYACYHGPAGLVTMAQRVHRLAATLADGLQALGAQVLDAHFFDTLRVRCSADRTMAAAVNAGFNLRRIDDRTVGISLDETSTPADVQALWGVFAQVCHGSEDGHSTVPPDTLPAFDALEAVAADRIPSALVRSSRFMEHPVFNSLHSETDMLRYLRRLMDKDLALDRTMIPLGSCTMKLNAAVEMIPVTWPEFGGMHPFAPADQAAGYRELLDGLEEMLRACTGYAAISLQPNSGAQGEYAGLLAIRGYHQSRGEGHRNVCLIPASAHGTNPATAQMAGMKVVVVATDQQGNVDLEDLQRKAEANREQLAAIMITYPSTHGVFEEQVRDVCRIVHENGGQVYIDGANLNAQVGLAQPGQYGGDVSHLNLHKTFCIPHGGGGPGVGPIGVGEHLVPFLPGHFAAPGRKDGAVTAAPFGSAGILPITWTYIRLMGARGLRQASEVAILSANYIAQRLVEHYPVLYSGRNGRVAHECIIDIRGIKERTGVTVEDVAKRLVDFGFHAPTMSFPVAGTLMIEPTESEPKAELDRFCDAMIHIRQEIEDVAQGRFDPADNPLRNAPHTAGTLLGEWSHPYSREQAAYPVASLRGRKYWPPVGRVDNVYGDRNLVCSCPPMSEYEEDLA